MLRILDKPAGLTTHTSLSADERQVLAIDPVDSFIGYVSHRTGQALYPVHRLDRGTTGLLLATDTPDEAAEISQLFETREVEKTYLFLTDATPDDVERKNSPRIRVESFIDRHTRSQDSARASNFYSIAPTHENPINAITEFERVSEDSGYTLWKARPLTGRPHQIRLHAESIGIPILGDNEHGGSVFPTLCLHACEIRFSFRGETIEASSTPPRWFSDLKKLNGRSGLRVANWLAGIERRERLDRSLLTFGIEPSHTRRLLHTDGDELRIDHLGEIIQLHWYGDEFDDLDRAAIFDLVETMNWQNWYLQTRPNRGKNPSQAEIILSKTDLASRWPAREGKMLFGFRSDTSMSAGLFLDQRANRRWVVENASGLRVLNLFSYTGGFSVAAATAADREFGVSKIVSVDLSKNFVAWSKENFVLNGLDPEQPRFEFRAMEARDFLKWAKKKGLQFDLVICDPPSFARTENGVFKIEKELEALWKLCSDVTVDGGRILFALNFELLTEAELFSRAEEFARTCGRTVVVSRTPTPDFDFEFPREPRSMKSLFFEFKSVPTYVSY